MRKLSPSLRCLLLFLGALYALYLLAGNIFLNTAIGSSTLNRRPSVFHAEWAWAWTAWPGQIHVHDLQILGHARKLLWSAHGQSAGGRLMLLPLLRREVRFGLVDASAVTVEIQSADKDLMPPPWRSDAWRITFDGIATSTLHSVRIGDLVLEGQGKGQVGFTHQMRGGPTEVFPSRVAMSEASLRYGALSTLQAATVDIAFAVDTVTHDRPPGLQKLGRAKVRVHVDAATPAIALGADKDGALAVTAASLDGHLNADFVLDHGTLDPGGRLHWNAAVAVTDVDGSQQRRHGQLDLVVQPDGVAIHAWMPPPANAGKAARNQLKADLLFGSRHVLDRKPADAVSLLSGAVDTQWHFASLRWLTPMLASAHWLRLDGAGDIDASVAIDRGRLLPGSRIDIPQVALTADILDNVFAGNAHARGRVVSDGGLVKTLFDLVVDRFTLAPKAMPGNAYLRGTALKVDVSSSDDLARLDDALTARLRFTRASVPDLRTYNRYLPGKSLLFESGAGTMSTDLTLDGKGDVSTGRLQLVADGARMMLGISHLVGNLRVDTELARAKREGHAFDLTGFSLGFDGVHVQGANDPPWWARATLEKGRLDWDRPMRLSGNVMLTMKDVSLLLSLYADRSAFPKWIAKVIDDGEATARGQVDMRRGSIVLDHIVASNKRVDLFARLRIAEGRPSGSLYARWGLLGLAVAMDNGHREFHLVDAAGWYREQPPFLPGTETSRP